MGFDCRSSGYFLLLTESILKYKTLSRLSLMMPSSVLTYTAISLAITCTGFGYYFAESNNSEEENRSLIKERIEKREYFECMLPRTATQTYCLWSPSITLGNLVDPKSLNSSSNLRQFIIRRYHKYCFSRSDHSDRFVDHYPP